MFENSLNCGYLAWDTYMKTTTDSPVFRGSSSKIILGSSWKEVKPAQEQPPCPTHPQRQISVSNIYALNIVYYVCMKMDWENATLPISYNYIHDSHIIIIIGASDNGKIVFRMP